MIQQLVNILAAVALSVGNVVAYAAIAAFVLITAVGVAIAIAEKIDAERRRQPLRRRPGYIHDRGRR